MLDHPRQIAEMSPYIAVTDTDWNSWKWQFSHRISTPRQLSEIVNLTEDEQKALSHTDGLFRLGITPHYATLIDPEDPNCPMRLQTIPKSGELIATYFEEADSLDEDQTSPVEGIVHRYPDRILFLVQHECSLYCRFCTRRRIVGDQQAVTTPILEKAFDYVRRTPTIRDVLISGGDPLALSDRRLEFILSRLREIPHVEIIRIGSRFPVVMPQRITAEFVEMLKQFHPLWFNTHFNHPMELAPQVTRDAMIRLADAGIPMGNQTVLLKGVNDCPIVMRQLVHDLVKVRCRPYYIYNCDLSEGLSHFRTPVSTGLAIIESLRGHTSGFCVPTFVVDAPNGGGKIPISPNYILASGNGRVTLRNFEGRIFTYNEGSATMLPTKTCYLCGTDHRKISIGPAKDLWELSGDDRLLAQDPSFYDRGRGDFSS